MSDTSLEQTEPTPPVENQSSEQGGFGVVEATETATVSAPVLPTTVTPVPPAAFKQPNRTGTVEHLAARRSVTPLNAEAPEVKQRLSDLRAELTTLVTDLRWGGYSVQATVEQLIPMLDVDSLQQWIPVLIPTILEIDRAGNLVPAWLKLVGEDDPDDLPADANPADTTIGRARRVAMLMLGYYKSPELSIVLGKLATDPSSSLYATQSRSEDHTSELQSLRHLVCRLLLEKKKIVSTVTSGSANVDYNDNDLNLPATALSSIKLVSATMSNIALRCPASIDRKQYSLSAFKV